jgi:hypothetical protein
MDKPREAFLSLNWHGIEIKCADQKSAKNVLTVEDWGKQTWRDRDVEKPS